SVIDCYSELPIQAGLSKRASTVSRNGAWTKRWQRKSCIPTRADLWSWSNCMTFVIDMRCRPPLPEFREYFDIPRITWHGARTGAKQVSRAFVEGSMELFFEEMEEAGINVAVVQGRNSPAVFMGKQFNAA